MSLGQKPKYKVFFFWKSPLTPAYNLLITKQKYCIIVYIYVIIAMFLFAFYCNIYSIILYYISKPNLKILVKIELRGAWTTVWLEMYDISHQTLHPNFHPVDIFVQSL